jgi:hypothetical protein
MNGFNRFAIATAALVAASVPSLSLAQMQPAPDQTQPSPAAAPDQTSMAPSASTAGMNTAATPAPADQLPPGQAQALATGDNRMVTNGPVPDTKANRAKYGQPMSHAGKKTPPAGN